MSGEILEILLVEDNPTDAELTLDALKKYNLTNKVKWVEDGADALDYIFATGKYAGRGVIPNPKVILLDLKLPKVDGIEVLRQIRADVRTMLIPVVVLTSSREEKDLVATYKLGVNSYIVKPVDINQFMESVAELGLYWILLNKIPDTV